MPVQKRSLRGFTLFELLIAITVLAILFIASTLVASSQMKKARDGKRKSDLNRIKVAVYDYYFDKNCFPDSLPACGEPLKLGETVYLNSFPCDPQKNPYVYEIEKGTCPSWFKALTNLENTADKDIDRVGCRTGCGPKCQYNYGVASSNISLSEGCIKYYACTPGSQCAEYDDPAVSQCPQVFKNDPTCQNACGKKENRCHDAKGKHIPD